MNILFFSRRFHPYIGGVEKHVLEISKRLLKQGHVVTIITEAVAGSPKKETIEGIIVQRINVGKEDRLKKFRIWKELFRLQDLINDADIIHCHDVFFWYLPFRFLSPQKPVYTTFHGYESYPIAKKAISMRKLSERLSFGNLCIGDFIPKWYGTNPTYVSYGAVELPKKENHVAVKKESAVFIGRLDEQTGILTYVQAIALLKKKYPKFEFIAVGDGDERKKIEQKVKVTGFQKNPERYFSTYHFAFVSRYLSILEAFAAKRLVIAVYDNPVKEDYLRMAPYAKWIVIEKTPEKIFEQVESLLANPQKEQKMVNAAYEWVAQQTWEKMIATYLRLWKIK